MPNNQGLEYLRYTRAFENAKWILTDKNSGEVTEYNYSEMSGIVIDAYISWHNNYLAKSYNVKELNPQNVTVRYLRQAGGLIAEINKRQVVSVGYSQILPDYTIDCYDWHYICNNCEAILDEIRGKGQERANRIFCPRCFDYSEYR